MKETRGAPGAFERAWLSYKEKVIPKDAGPIQVQETRRAFYAGGFALFQGIAVVLEDEGELTDEDIGDFEAVGREFAAFEAQLRQEAVLEGLPLS